MADINALDSEIKGPLTSAVNAATAKIAELEAQLAAATGVDTSPQIAAVQSLETTLYDAVNPPAPQPGP